MSLVGGISDSSVSANSTEIQELAQFAVDENNKKSNSLLGLSRVVDVKTQVVAGTIYYLTLEVNEGGEKKLYSAKIWTKPWLNFKELQEFKQA